MRAAVLSVVMTLAGAAVARADDVPPPKPWLGVSISDQGVRWGGIVVLDVFEDTPASLCGLRAGDEIFTIDRVEVHGTTELQHAVGAHAVGDKLRLEYVRGTAIRKCTVKLAEAVTDPTELIQRRAVDRAIPPFALERRSDGAVLDDTSTRGAVLVLALISTACDRCAATLDDLAAAVDGTGAQLYAVTADGAEAADAFVQRTGVTVELALEGLDGARDGLVRRYLNDRDDATILLVDHEGIIRFAAVGAGLDAANLDGATFCAKRAARAKRKAD